MTTQYSVNTYRNTYSHSIEPIRLEDFKDVQLYITDNEYRSTNLFKEKVELKAKALNLAQLQGRPKKRRIRKAIENKPKRELRCSHYKQIGYNRRGYRNRRKELEVVVVDSEGEDKLAQVLISSQFSYVLELDKISFFFLRKNFLKLQTT